MHADFTELKQTLGTVSLSIYLTQTGKPQTNLKRNQLVFIKWNHLGSSFIIWKQDQYQ